MYFQPVFLSPFSYYCNYVMQELPRQAVVPDSAFKIDVVETTCTSVCAAEKFTQLLNQRGTNQQVNLSTNYMNLSFKYSHVELPSKEEFVPIYRKIIQKYRLSYVNGRVKKSWSQLDVLTLLWLVNWVYRNTGIHPVDFSKEDWAVVATIIPFRTDEDCMFKWLSMRKNQLEEFPWTPQEKKELSDQLDIRQIPDWTQISKNLHLKFPQTFRTPKQCKESWSIISSSRYDRSKKFWSEAQDLTLFEAYLRFGRKWKMISALIEGRSENAIKNRFTLLSQKYNEKELQTMNNQDLIRMARGKLTETTTNNDQSD